MDLLLKNELRVPHNQLTYRNTMKDTLVDLNIFFTDEFGRTEIKIEKSQQLLGKVQKCVTYKLKKRLARIQTTEDPFTIRVN